MRPMADVVVVQPGIIGSVQDSRGRDLWAPTAGTVARALVTLWRSVTELELCDQEADDGVTAPRMIPNLHVAPGLWKIDRSSKRSGYLQRQFAVTPGENFFTFPYDWRRDNLVGARRLREQAAQWLWESALSGLAPVSDVRRGCGGEISPEPLIAEPKLGAEKHEHEQRLAAKQAASLDRQRALDQFRRDEVAKHSEVFGANADGSLYAEYIDGGMTSGRSRRSFAETGNGENWKPTTLAWTPR